MTVSRKGLFDINGELLAPGERSHIEREAHERLAVALSETGGDVDKAIEVARVSRSQGYAILSREEVKARVKELESAKHVWMRVKALRTLVSALDSEDEKVRIAASRAVLAEVRSNDDPGGDYKRGRKRLVVELD